MSPKPAIVVSVLALLGVLAVTALYRGEPEAATAGETIVVPETARVTADAVTRITLDRREAHALVFERTADGWMQTAPFAFPVQPYSMRELAAGVPQLRVVKVLDDADETELGLRPPRAVLTCEWPQGAVSVSFGRRGVAGRAYVKVGGTVYVATGPLYERAVETDPREWRQRAIFEGVSVDADEIEIDDGATRTLLRREPGGWAMILPVRTRVDESARNTLLAALERAQSGGFILDEPDDLSPFGLDEPSGVVAIRTSRPVSTDDGVVREQREQRLLVGSRMGVGAEDRFGMVAGRATVIRLPEAVLAAFFGPPVRLIDPTATGAGPEDVKAIVIRTETGERSVERDLDTWRDDAGEEADGARVRALLDLLTSARAARIRVAPYPREHELATITLRGFDARPLDTVRIATDPETGQLILENGDNVLRVLPPAESETLAEMLKPGELETLGS